MKSESLVFFGTDQFSLPALQALYESEVKIVAVVTRPDRPAGRGAALKAPETKVLAESLGLRVLQPEKLSECLDEIKSLGATAGIAVSYGVIIPKSIIELFPKGIINIHPSLLPKYRGPSPIETTIINGDTKTGVTLMLIDEGMDTGEILLQSQITLTGNESKKELSEVLSKLGVQLLAQNLQSVLEGKITPVPQDESQASVSKMMSKPDGELDWRKPANQLEREIRAYLGWPGSRTTLFGREITITHAHTDSTITERTPGEAFVTQKKELAVTCNPGVLIVDRLKPAGKNEMSAQAFLAGIRN